MNTPINGGGPAFPTANGPECFNAPGMTLRDWFAGMALVGMLGCPADVRYNGKTEVTNDDMASCAYGLADAMIAQRGTGAKGGKG